MTVLRNWAPAELVRHIRISCAFVKYIQRNEIVLRDVEHSRRHHLVETDHFLILSPYEWKKQNEPTNERPNDTERYCVRLMKSDRKKKTASQVEWLFPLWTKRQRVSANTLLSPFGIRYREQKTSRYGRERRRERREGKKSRKAEDGRTRDAIRTRHSAVN